MITGLELALAVVPLAIVATEYHKKAFRKAKLIASPKARDEKLLDFLYDLHVEVALLYHTLKRLINDLSTLTEQQRLELINLDRKQWDGSEIGGALKMRLGNEDELAFTNILGRLLRSLNDVVSEKSLQFISEYQISSLGIFKKLEVFRKQMEDGTNPQDLRSRFQFTTKEDRRTRDLKQIRKCNKDLERFVHGQGASIVDDSQRFRLGALLMDILLASSTT